MLRIRDKHQLHLHVHQQPLEAPEGLAAQRTGASAYLDCISWGPRLHDIYAMTARLRWFAARERWDLSRRRLLLYLMRLKCKQHEQG